MSSAPARSSVRRLLSPALCLLWSCQMPGKMSLAWSLLLWYGNWRKAFLFPCRLRWVFQFWYSLHQGLLRISCSVWRPRSGSTRMGTSSPRRSICRWLPTWTWWRSLIPPLWAYHAGTGLRLGYRAGLLSHTYPDCLTTGLQGCPGQAACRYALSQNSFCFLCRLSSVRNPGLRCFWPGFSRYRMCSGNLPP